MMRFLFSLSITVALILPLSAQNYDHTNSAKVSGSVFTNPKRQKDAPVGSPYIQQSFAMAKVPNIDVEAYMRYNAYNDEFEFITPKNDTLVLDKVDDFSHIDFVGLKKKYRLLAYTNSGKLKYGYLIAQYEKGDFVLLRKENIGYINAKIAKTSYERDMPARYDKKGDSYFLQSKNGISGFPDSKKELTKLFPDKKQAIEDFLKSNKIDFDSESDLIKMVDFLAAQ
jgi:hypothetical protein